MPKQLGTIIMLVSLATMDFRLSFLLQEKLALRGIATEQIVPGKPAARNSVLVVTTEEEFKNNTLTYEKLVVLSRSEVMNISKAITKVLLGLEGKRIWESLIIGVDPGRTIGVAIITDGCLRGVLETREINEAVDYIFLTIRNNPAKMVIIRIGSTGGYRRILLLNELLNNKPSHVSIEVVDELQTTPASCQDAREGILNSSREGQKLIAGKDASAAMEIAFRLGESVKSQEQWEPSEGELKEIQVLSRQYSRGKVTISKDQAIKVAKGLLTLEEAIENQKKRTAK
ncbi:MAG: hypothetical protein K9W42_00965 [Candidatus Heimdallarchaeota archaeon]|nr:hypothetical protein [Candidatus Heimdallarchaeota archaeon]